MVKDACSVGKETLGMNHVIGQTPFPLLFQHFYLLILLPSFANPFCHGKKYNIIIQKMET